MTTALALYGAVCSTLAIFLVLRSTNRKSEGQSFHPPDSGPPLGALMTSQTAVDMGGKPLVIGGDGEQLLAFFSTTCQGCLSSLPRFVSTLQASGLSHDAVVAVLVGPSATAERTLTEALSGVTRLVREQEQEAISSAYNVQMFPSYVRLDNGVVVAKGPSPADVLPIQRVAAGNGVGQS